MINPVYLYNRFKRMYLKYIDTGIEIHDRGIREERNELLAEQNQLIRRPIIETIRKYEGKDDILSFCKQNEFDPDFAAFVRAGLFHYGDRKLYACTRR